MDELFPIHSFRTAWNGFGDFGVVFDVERNEVLEISQVAVDIWARCDGTRSVGQICNEIAAEYNAPAEDICQDVHEFLRQVGDRGLLRFSRTAGSAFASDEFRGRRPISQLVEGAQDGYLIDGKVPLEGKLIKRLARLHVPYSVQIEMTYRCNEKCLHCYCIRDERPELTTEEIRRVLVDLRQLGSMKLILTGGEPLLRRDFFEVVEVARDLRYTVDIFTNGLLLDERAADRLAAAYVKTVQSSIYSADARVHDGITGIPGSLERTLNALRICSARAIPIAIKAPLMRDTAAGFREIKALARSLGAGLQMSVTIAARNDGSQDTRELWPTEEDIRQVLQDPDIQIGFHEPVDVGQLAKLKAPVCGAGNTLIHVNPYGDVLPCVALQVPGGDIRERSIEEIWKLGTIFETMRKTTVEDLPQCFPCEHLPYCTRCPGLALLEDGDLFGRSTNDCRLAGIMHEVREERCRAIPHP